MSENLNPMSGIFKEFEKVIKNVVIKYNSKAEEYETLESKANADGYFDAVNKRDNFYTYRDYNETELRSVGITDTETLGKALSGNTRIIPGIFQEKLLTIRRQRCIDSFEEQNNYYRMLNGFPDVNDKTYFYISETIAQRLNIDVKIPIHKIQDYYNKLNGRGDYYITTIEGLGIIDTLINENPTKEYLKYIGSNRISLETARTAKNFAIIKLQQGSIRSSVYERFLSVYEQCRVYFINTIYNPSFRDFIDYYDNFIAMSIMLMTICQMIMKQIPLSIKREYFDIYSIRLLYEAYNVPYNINIDEYTQRNIAQRLNLLIQNKSTNKVIFDIAELLGFSSIDIYKYYLIKERKFDKYGVPVVGTSTKFNSTTGEMETITDTKKMYDLYFQKVNVNEQDISQAFNSNVNRVDYDDIVENDPYWWGDDASLQDQLWNREYSYIETKYLGLGISYKLSDIIFENILLLKMMMQKENELALVNISLPKIYNDKDVSLFDAIIMLCCLTCKKHHLGGEIISVPSQVVAVLDYMKNIEAGDEQCVDSFSFNFDFFKEDNGGDEAVQEIIDLLGEEDGKEFLGYINTLKMNMGITNNEKITAINNMYHAAKNLYNFINYHVATAKTRKEYEALKTFYRAAFYSKEMKSMFSINIESEENARTAWNFFEYLHWKNPKFYSSIFTEDIERQYLEYLETNNETMETYTLNQFDQDIASGKVKIRYDTLKEETNDDNTSSVANLLYYYIDHIISRIEEIVDDLQYIYLVNDSNSPLTELLIKMIRFFKSYTVDMLDLDLLFICNIKLDNIVRLYDEIKQMTKVVYPEDCMKMSYADVMHRMVASIDKDDKLKLYDWYSYGAIIYLYKKYNQITDIKFQDVVHAFEKTIQVSDNKNGICMYDTARIASSNIRSRDDMKMTDKVFKIWYSD